MDIRVWWRRGRSEVGEFAGESARLVADFVDELCGLADTRPRLRPVIATLTRPARVAVTGRPGVGLRTVTRALSVAGLDVVGGAEDADVVVLVIVEAVKPEERRIYTDSTGPLLILLNRADLLADPHARATEIGAATGLPTVPMTALPDGVDDVVRALAAVGAPSRYRRLRAALTRLRALAATDQELAETLAGDTAVLAMMAAADDVVRAAGRPPDSGPRPRRAVGGQRDGGGPGGAHIGRAG
ncbi:hypothetical protein ACWDUN_26925, partial [Mycobacterium sp. NPDC003323]